MSIALDRLIDELRAHVPRASDDAARRQAAVALLLTADPDRLLLIRRAEHAGDPWSGHLALPGGRREPVDADLLDTAIRETREETGVILRREECVAVLDDLAPVSPVLPPIMVRPFVFRLPADVVLTLSAEVAHAEWIGMAELTAEGIYRRRTLEVRGAPLEVMGYHLGQGFLWGMTERMLSPVLDRWRQLTLPSP